jgi:hypothetical protein
MRTAIVLVLLVVPTFAVAQSGGHISVYSDGPGWSDCNLVEVVMNLNHAYVVHSLVSEASKSQSRCKITGEGSTPGRTTAGTSTSDRRHMMASRYGTRGVSRFRDCW